MGTTGKTIDVIPQVSKSSHYLPPLSSKRSNHKKLFLQKISVHVCNAYTEHVRTAVARAITAGSDLVVINVSWVSGL